MSWVWRLPSGKSMVRRIINASGWLPRWLPASPTADRVPVSVVFSDPADAADRKLRARRRDVPCAVRSSVALAMALLSGYRAGRDGGNAFAKRSLGAFSVGRELICGGCGTGEMSCAVAASGLAADASLGVDDSRAAS